LWPSSSSSSSSSRTTTAEEEEEAAAAGAAAAGAAATAFLAGILLALADDGAAAHESAAATPSKYEVTTRSMLYEFSFRRFAKAASLSSRPIARSNAIWSLTSIAGLPQVSAHD